MKASELIREFEKLIAKHGDFDVAIAKENLGCWGIGVIEYYPATKIKEEYCLIEGSKEFNPWDLTRRTDLGHKTV